MAEAEGRWRHEMAGGVKRRRAMEILMGPVLSLRRADAERCECRPWW